MSRWIRNVFREAGFDTEDFKGPSTRSVSTSKARLRVLSLTDILESCSWCNASNFQRIYNRQVDSFAEKYKNKILS